MGSKHIFPAIGTAIIAGVFWLGIAYPHIGTIVGITSLFLVFAALVYGLFYKVWNG